MKYLYLVIFILLADVSKGQAQDTSQLLSQVAQVYTGSEGSSSGLIAGFSMWGLMAGLVFSGIGFVAFVYGKKNSEYKPMLLGILLMMYPYFLRGTVMLYLVGIALTAVLYFFRE